MSLDIKYRPRRYEDVIGQKTITDILKKIVSSGKGFHQSYLFTGPYGSGKTTLARILARALLCSNPVNGEPCDKCDSCVDIIEKGYSECLTEIDAATNSGKESVRQMIETLDYSTFSGKKRLWILDECFTADTVVITIDGPKTIKEISETRYSGRVLSRDLDTGNLIWDDVVDWFDLGEREVIEVTFDNGVSVKVTDNQTFYTKNRGWVSVNELTEDDDVDSDVFFYSRKNTKSIKAFCGCGCRTVMGAFKKSYYQRKRIKGHATKNNSSVKNDKFWERVLKSTNTKCICGCGGDVVTLEMVKSHKRGKYPVYIPGHEKKVMCACGCGTEIVVSDKYYDKTCVQKHGWKMVVNRKKVDFEKRRLDWESEGHICQCGCADRKIVLDRISKYIHPTMAYKLGGK